jgi:hypothetical protein
MAGPMAGMYSSVVWDQFVCFNCNPDALDHDYDDRVDYYITTILLQYNNAYYIYVL